MSGADMAGSIVKPKNIMDKERYMVLSPENRKKYLENLIRELIHLNKGITVAEIMKTLLLSYDTVRRHLTTLEAVGEIYCVRYGNSEAYFPNGRNVHPEDEIEIVDGDNVFVFSVLSNQFDDFLFIQEKKADSSGRRRSKGAIMVPLRCVADFYGKSSTFVGEYIKKKNGAEVGRSAD